MWVWWDLLRNSSSALINNNRLIIVFGPHISYAYYYASSYLSYISFIMHQFLCSFWVSVLWFYDGISYNSHNEGEYNNLFTEKIHKFLVMQHCFRIEIFMSDWTLNECGEVKGCREGDLTLKLLRDGVEHCLLKALSRPDINSHDKERQKA